MTRDEATAAIAKHGSQRAACKVLRCSRKTIRKALAQRDGPDAATPTGKRVAGAIPLRDVLAGYDRIGKVVEMAKAVPTGSVRTDESMRLDIGVSEDRWRTVRGSTRVSGHVFRLPDGKWVWGDKRTIASITTHMRELLV